MIGDPEIRYLPTFLAACEEGGFHRAARRLHLSQAAVSYQIRQLEKLLKVALFDRVGRGVVLNERGHLLREFCNRTFSDLAAVRKALKEGRTTVGGTLKVATVSAFGRYVLFPVLRDQFTDVRLDLRFQTQDEVLRLVEGGVSDIGFLYEGRVSSALVTETVAEEELVLIRPAAKSLPRPRAIEEIETQPFVTWVECEYVFGRWFETVYGRQPLPLTSVAHFEELEEVVDFVALGRGLSIVPDHSARRSIAEGEVRIVRPVRGRRCTNEIHAVVRTGAWRSEAVTRLLERFGAGVARH